MPFVAFSHGANDAQKTMAKITLALFGSGYLPEVPTLARSSRAAEGGEDEEDAPGADRPDNAA
jgi:hypothetical protein